MRPGPVGSWYRERREQLGIPIEVAADATNIRARMLETLESGDYRNYPPHGHAVGMLSSYARYLELDPRPLLEQYEEEFAAFEAGEEIATSAERTRRGVGRFGERVSPSGKPLPREGARGSRPQGILRRRRRDEDDSASRLNEKLDKERVAEGDDRYKSGTVKVIGTRQTGSFRRVGASTASRAMGRVGASRTTGQARSHRSQVSSSPSSSRRGRDLDRTGRESPRRGGLEARADRSGTERRSPGPARYRFSSSDGARRRTSSSARASERPEYAVSARTGRKRSAFSSSLEAARRHQEEISGTAQPNRSDQLSFFGGAAIGREDGDSGQGRRRPRTHRPPRDEQPPAADGNVFMRILEMARAALSESRTRIIVLAFALIVIGVFIAAGVLISTAGGNDSDVINVDGGAADDSTTTQGPDAATTTVTTTNGSPVNVTIAVAEGQTSLISVTYDDDNAYSGTAVGPWERSFYVTDSLSASFQKADAVTVTENGNPVSFERKEDGSGAFNLEITTTTSSTETTSETGQDSASAQQQ